MDNWITFLDIIFFITLFISCVTAYVDGLISEVLGILVWVISALAIKILYPYTEPFMANLVGESGLLSSVLTYFSIFILMVISLSFVSKKVSKRISRTDFKAADKSLGFVFGIFRGILITALIYVFLLWFIPNREDRPNWIQTAKVRPMLTIFARGITILLPSGGSFDEIREILNTDEKYQKTKDSEIFNKLTNPKSFDDNKYPNNKKADFKGYNQNDRDNLDEQLRELEQIEKDFLND